MLAVAGVTASEDSDLVATVTVSVAAPLIPLSEAVMVDDPAASVVTIPAVVMVAIDGEELDQVTDAVTLTVDPSL
jgi:hypothetical protein